MQVETFNPIEFLQEIATEQRFAVTYVDIEETSQSGEELNKPEWHLNELSDTLINHFFPLPR